MFSFVKKPPNCLPGRLYHLAFPPAMNDNSSPAFDIISALDSGHSSRCIVVSHWCFSLHFLDDI